METASPAVSARRTVLRRLGCRSPYRVKSPQSPKDNQPTQNAPLSVILDKGAFFHAFQVDSRSTSVGTVQKDWVCKLGLRSFCSMKWAASQPSSNISTSMAVSWGLSSMENG